MADFKLCGIKTSVLETPFTISCNSEKLISDLSGECISEGATDKLFSIACDGKELLAICSPHEGAMASSRVFIKTLVAYAKYHNLDECEIVCHEFPDGCAEICLKTDDKTFTELFQLENVLPYLNDDYFPKMMNVP